MNLASVSGTKSRATLAITLLSMKSKAFTWPSHWWHHLKKLGSIDWSESTSKSRIMLFCMLQKEEELYMNGLLSVGAWLMMLSCLKWNLEEANIPFSNWTLKWGTTWIKSRERPGNIYAVDISLQKIESIIFSVYTVNYSFLILLILSEFAHLLMFSADIPCILKTKLSLITNKNEHRIDFTCVLCFIYSW